MKTSLPEKSEKVNTFSIPTTPPPLKKPDFCEELPENSTLISNEEAKELRQEEISRYKKKVGQNAGPPEEPHQDDWRYLINHKVDEHAKKPEEIPEKEIPEPINNKPAKRKCWACDAWYLAVEKNCPQCDADKNSPYSKTYDGFCKALAILEIKLRINKRQQQREFMCKNDDWKHFNDLEFNTLKTDLETFPTEKGNLTFGVDRFSQYATTLAGKNIVDPFKEYVTKLSAWDGIPRLDSLLHTLFIDEKEDEDSENCILAEWCSRYIFIGAIQRAFEPGCRLRQIPVLVSPENIGKSAMLESIFPPDKQDDWFTNSLTFHDTSTKRMEKTMGRVLVEWDELDGIRKSELATLKSFISTTADRDRLAYRRDAETFKRMFIIVGTTNDIESLPNDPGGNTRYVPVTLHNECIVEKFMEKNREQLWTEALQRYQAGERANLPRELQDLQKHATGEHRHRDDLEEFIESKLDVKQKYTLAQAASTVGMIQFEIDFATMSNQHQNRLKTGMQNCGWQQKRIDNQRIWTK